MKMTKEISVCYCDDCGKEIAKDRRENCRWCKADLCENCAATFTPCGLPNILVGESFCYCKKCLPKVIKILRGRGSNYYITEIIRGNTNVIEDGFGNAWSASCPECGKKTMFVVRPGKVQCSNCG